MQAGLCAEIFDCLPPQDRRSGESARRSNTAPADAGVASRPRAADMAAASTVLRIPLQINTRKITANRLIANAARSPGAGIRHTEPIATLRIRSAERTQIPARPRQRGRRRWSGIAPPGRASSTHAQGDRSTGSSGNTQQPAQEISPIRCVHERSSHLIESTVIHGGFSRAHGHRATAFTTTTKWSC
jgi:hypothetical protein